MEKARKEGKHFEPQPKSKRQKKILSAGVGATQLGSRTREERKEGARIAALLGLVIWRHVRDENLHVPSMHAAGRKCTAQHSTAQRCALWFEQRKQGVLNLRQG